MNMQQLRKIEPLQAKVGDYVVRVWDGKPGNPERITSIYAQGTSVFGKQYVLGYSDYFGDSPKSEMSFSASEEDKNHHTRDEVYTLI
jgi:hypothetical protein